MRNLNPDTYHYVLNYSFGSATAKVTVTFIQQMQQQPSPQDIYTQATSGSPTLNDPLTGQDSNYWNVGISNGEDCAFIEELTTLKALLNLALLRFPTLVNLPFRCK